MSRAKGKAKGLQEEGKVRRKFDLILLYEITKPYKIRKTLQDFANKIV